MSESIICARSFEFGARILALCEKIWSRGVSGRHIASQLMRSGTSIGANAEEAQDGQSKKDFIAKMCVSRKETRETVFWLRLAVRAKVVSANEVAWELDEARQLLAMIRSAVLTAEKKRRRKTDTPPSPLSP
jgi:four helix bundle protein